MLVAAQSLFMALGWLVAASSNSAAWFVLVSAIWICLRTTGAGSGRITTLLVSACLVCGSFLIWRNTGESLPNWLRSGPFSMIGCFFILILVSLVDLLDILLARGWSADNALTFIKDQIARFATRYWKLILLALFAFYAIAIPAIEILLEGGENPYAMPFGSRVLIRTTEVFTACICFVQGACVGSFLNVVVYRTPRGESLIRKRSSCPKCDSKIAGRDNIPVFGWINLNGRCRDCQFPISARYPIVEALTGTLFLLFYFVELLSGGQNLPARNPNTHTGVVWILFYTKWDLLRLSLFHGFLVIVLMTWALIRFDRERVPLRSYFTTFLLALTPIVIWPNLLLIGAFPDQIEYWNPSVTESLTTSATGFVVGLGVSMLIQWLLHVTVSNQEGFEPEFIAGLSLTGMMLGWQAALSAVAIALVVRFIQVSLAFRFPVGFRKWPLTGSLFIAVVFQLLLWRIIATTMPQWWPTFGVELTSLVIWALFVCGMIMLCQRRPLLKNLA